MLRHVIRSVLICLTLCGCATSASMFSPSPSLTTSREPAKSRPAATQAAQAAQEDSGSGLGGIWSNFSSVFSSDAQPTAQRSDAGGAGASQALRLINSFRSAKGLAPLSIDPQATEAAEVLAKDMAAHDRMSHTGPDGQDVGKRLLAAGYNYSIASQNLAVGQTTVEQTVAGWKASPSNSRNLLLPNARHIGLAYESRPESQHKTFWVLVVAAP